jgi:hypothetical protein
MAGGMSKRGQYGSMADRIAATNAAGAVAAHRKGSALVGSLRRERKPLSDHRSPRPCMKDTEGVTLTPRPLAFRADQRPGVGPLRGWRAASPFGYPRRP